MTWNAVPIGTVIHSSQYGLSLPTDPEGRMPIVGMKDIQNGRVQIDSTVCVNLNDNDARDYLLANGDILLNRTNSPDLVGKAGIYRGTGKAVFASYLVRLELDRDKVDPDYVIQILAGEFGQHRIKQLATRAISQANLNPTTFKKHFHIPLPALREQVRIRNLLLAWDSAIAKTERLILVKNLALRQHQKRLFGNRHWRQQRIANLFSQVTRKVDKLDVPVATISAGKGFMTQQDRFSRVLAGRNLTNYTCLRRGEFAYNKGNSKTYEFGCAYLLADYPELVIPNVYVSFAPKVPLVPEFYALWFEADLLKRQLRRVVNSGVRNDGLLNINAATFFKLSLPVPSIGEQKAISAALLASKDEIAILKKQLQALKTQKRGLMQKLLTGQWRLKLHKSAAT